MKFKILTLLVSTVFVASCSAIKHEVKIEKPTLKDGFPETVTLFENKKGGYPRYRIPNLIITPKGTLIAVIEGRQGGDHSKNDIIAKRSEDGGKTWSEHVVLADQGNDVLIDSNSVVDSATGRIIIGFNKMAWGYHNTKAVKGYDSPKANRHYIIHSDDDGKSWSKLKEITKAVKPKNVTHAVFGPGAKGICISKGVHKGRLVFPVYRNEPHSTKSKDRKVYCVFSDDHGKTWERGNLAEISVDSDPAGDTSEPHIVELADGRLLINSRSPNKKVDKRFRRQAYSKDGGKTWTKMTYAKDLLDPGCCASIVSTNYKGKDVLVFINPYSTKGRVNGTVSLSYDEGKTWPVHKNIHPPTKTFGYSSSVVMSDGSIGVFFEGDAFNKMNFLRFSLDWVLE